MPISRLLLRAFFASFVLHCVILFALRASFIRPVAELTPPSRTMVLRISSPTPSEAVRVESPVQAVRQTRVGAAAPPMVSPKSQAVRAQVVSPQAVQPGAASDLQVPGVVVQQSEPSAGNTGGQTFSREALDADGLRQYRLALARESRRFKCYPPLARERGWEGVVNVLVEVSIAGGLPEVSLAHGSGYDSLDRQALEMVGQAVRAAPLPESLQGKGFRLSLPVRYSLEE